MARRESLAAGVVVWLFDSLLFLPLGISSASEEINHRWCDLCGLSLFNSFSGFFFLFSPFNIFYWASSALWPPFFPSIPSLASSLTSRLQSPPAAPPPSAFAFVVSFSQFTFRDHHSDFSFRLVLLLFNFRPLPFRFLAPAVMTFSPFTPFNLVRLCFWAFQSTFLASSAAKPLKLCRNAFTSLFLSRPASPQSH